MATNPIPGDRDELADFIDKQVLPGMQPALYTQMVQGMNDILRRAGFPITSQFRTIVQHNIVQVERGQMSAPKAHFNEVCTLTRDATGYWKIGDTFKAFVCLGGVLGNICAGFYSGGEAGTSHKSLRRQILPGSTVRPRIPRG